MLWEAAWSSYFSRWCSVSSSNPVLAAVTDPGGGLTIIVTRSYKAR